jgi:hypothetical protein
VDDLHLLISTYIGEKKISYQEALLQVVDPNIRAKHEKNPYKLCSVCILSIHHKELIQEMWVDGLEVRTVHLMPSAGDYKSIREIHPGDVP